MIDMSFFCRTYAGDVDWLQWLVKSIRRFCSGYRDFVFAFPQKDGTTIVPQLRGFKTVVLPDDKGRGYLEQQAAKMLADTLCSAEYIAFVDSDCIFTERNTPETWLADGRLQLLVTPYEVLGKSVPWRAPTEKALGFSCPFETMRRHPGVYPTGLLQRCRLHVEQLHKQSIRDYILAQDSFSEFNVIGSYAVAKEPHYFTIIDTSKSPLPKEFLKQRWSYGRVTPEIAAENERMLA